MIVKPFAQGRAAVVDTGSGVAVRDAGIGLDPPQGTLAGPALGAEPDAALLAALAAARARLASDQAIWLRMQDISMRLVLPGGDIASLLGELLEAALSITACQAGCVFLVPSAGASTGPGPVVVAQRNLPDRAISAVESFGAVGSALLPAHGRVVVADLSLGKHQSPDLLSAAFTDAGFRGYHATALVSRDGRLLGAILLFAGAPHAPDDRDMRVVDLLARQVADYIDRCRSDEQAASIRANLKAILDSVSDAIITFDARGLIRTANPATGRMFGERREALVGRSIADLAEKAGLPSGLEAILSRLQGAESIVGHRVECTMRRSGGTPWLAEVVVTELEHGRSFTCSIRDITQRREQEAKARQSDRLAAMGTLAAGLGHDMNNMLLPVRAHLNALSMLTDGESPSRGAPHIKEISQAVRYLQQLADGLHYLATDAGHADVGAEGARLLSWWQATGSLLRRSLPPLTEVEVGIPPSLPPLRVSAHALTQAVLNIFVNAGDAILARGDGTPGRVGIGAHVDPRGRSVALSIRDNGTGMTEDVRRRAMDMFFTTKPRGLGTGLGLALVNRVVHEAGGTITLESELGVGTTVTLHLPFAADPRSAGAARVAVTIGDARAAEFACAALEGRGCAASIEESAPDADAWIVDPRIVMAEDASAWKQRRRGRTVILFGQPHRVQAAAWKGIASGVIPAATDFDSLLVCVDQVGSIINRRVRK